MNKKAQMVGQIFIYILALVVVALIILYGYSAIKDFRKRETQVEFITLKTSMENEFKSIISDFGSIKRPDLSISGKYKKVCFVDTTQPDTVIINQQICSGFSSVKEPIVCEGWKTKRNNFYFIPDGSDAINVGRIAFKTEYYKCFDVVNNKINLQLKSLGDSVEICEYVGSNCY